MKNRFRNKGDKVLALCMGIVLAALLYRVQDARGFERRNAVVIAVEKASPAVVNISTVVREKVSPAFPFSGQDFFKDFFPDLFPREYSYTTLGSGVIIDGKNGYILTNQHVIAGSTEIKVITSDQTKYKAQVLGSDPHSDLAVLKIRLKGPLPDLKMGNSDDLMIGETVIAIGNPFGLSHTVTTGVVSALNRTVRSEENVYRNFIQTDASINPGNSGGPLLNINGELVGINTAIYQKAQGIGFAIPISKAKRIVRELLKAGEVRFPWLGLELQELTPGLREHFRLPKKERGGVLVRDIVKGSPADRADLNRGDILLAVEKAQVFSVQGYQEILSDFTPEDRLELTIFRNGREERIRVQPEVFPTALALDFVDQHLGIKVGQADATVKRRYGIKNGVMVMGVREGSNAQRMGLDRGDLILKVNNTPVEDLKAFKRAVSRYHHLPSMTLLIRRGAYGYSLTLPL